MVDPLGLFSAVVRLQLSNSMIGRLVHTTLAQFSSAFVARSGDVGCGIAARHATGVRYAMRRRHQDRGHVFSPGIFP